MASALQITDGTTTVTLTSTNMKLLHYYPLASPTDITETAEVFFTTGSASERTDIASINRLFEQARRYQLLRIGSAVYVEYKPSASDAAYYRSEVKDGSIVIGNAQRASIIWTRRPYWEGPETQIPLTNESATANTSGLTVYNHDDLTANHDNYAGIVAADVIGDLPAPPRIEITNNYNSATDAGQVYIAHNVNSPPLVFDQILEGEEGTGGTNTSDANSSGGYYKALSWAATTETDLLTWQLSAIYLKNCAGNYFRFLMRLQASLAYTDLWLRLKILMASTTAWQSELVLARSGHTLQEVATLQLPPYMVGSGESMTDKTYLVLSARRNAGGTHTLDVDFAQLSPMDGWRNLQSIAYNTPYQAILMDDMIRGYTYTDTAGGMFGNYYTNSSPIMLIPNKAQRLYFLHEASTGTAPIARTLSIKVYYRPRRSTI
jgi:hypothetical protein